jgi:hypothetical protein
LVSYSLEELVDMELPVIDTSYAVLPFSVCKRVALKAVVERTKAETQQRVLESNPPPPNGDLSILADVSLRDEVIFQQMMTQQLRNWEGPTRLLSPALLEVMQSVVPRTEMYGPARGNVHRVDVPDILMWHPEEASALATALEKRAKEHQDAELACEALDAGNRWIERIHHLAIAAEQFMAQLTASLQPLARSSRRWPPAGGFVLRDIDSDDDDMNY